MKNQPKWLALGDVNPRDYGGIYVRVWPKSIRNEIEVVKIDPIDEDPKKGYRSQYASYDWEELQQVMDNKEQPYDFADLKRFEGPPTGPPTAPTVALDEFIHWVALAKMDYFGTEGIDDESKNFWQLLRSYGIRPDNIK